MFKIANPIVWVIGVIALGAALFSLRVHFSAEARGRRRERSHRPVVSRKQGPTVRLAVQAGKPICDRKR
jgi:hypothetical protein